MGQSRIMIIDGNQAEARFLGMQLESAGYEVVVVEEVRDGFTQAVRELPDLIVMETRGETDLGFCRLIRRHTDLPVIIIGKDHYEQEELKSLEAGTDDYLIKPFSIEILTLKIKAILRRRKITAKAWSDEKTQKTAIQA